MMALTKEVQTHGKYEKFLNGTCKIDFKWLVSKDAKELKWRELTGLEKLRLFSHTDIPLLLPQEDDRHIIQQIWVDFFNINKKITNCQANVEVYDDIWKWMRLFLSVDVTKHITPYMHEFLYHVSEFLEVYGNINLFKPTRPGKAQPRLMTMSPLYPCGKPCSRGTHHETVKNLALFLQSSMELRKNHGFESPSCGSVFNSSIASKILSPLHHHNSNSQISQSDWC